jgi:hypothetical protein
MHQHLGPQKPSVGIHQGINNTITATGEASSTTHRHRLPWAR